MKHKLIFIDPKDLARFEDDGGFIPPDESEEELRRVWFADLRYWLVAVVGDEEGYCIAASLASGELSAAELGRLTDRHRSSALRRKRKFFRELRRKIETSPHLQASMPAEIRSLLMKG